MPLEDEITVGEARTLISDFLADNGCYKICAKCPVYGSKGCCEGCDHLVEGEGCNNQNLSCLSYTCGVLNMHLSRQGNPYHGNQLIALTDLLYGLPREGYRGCTPRLPGEELQIGAPLEEMTLIAEVPAGKRIFTPLTKEDSQEG